MNHSSISKSTQTCAKWLLLIAIFFAFNIGEAQKQSDTVVEKKHRVEGAIGVTFNQIGITQWAAGGESNGSGKISASFKHTYKQQLFNYETTGLFTYGLSSYAKDKRVEKTEDRCELSLTMTHNNSKNLTFTSIATLKTQFAKGYSYPNDSVPISDFFAPGYLTLSIGYTYSIKNIVTIFGSPAAGKITFVTNQELADKGAFGVEGGYWNIVNNDSTWMPGKKLLCEIGFNILVKYKQDFNNISVFSTLNLYNNYLDSNKSNRWNIDVNWETGLTFIFNKRISTVVNIHLIYDDNILFPYTETIDGETVSGQRPRLQLKESLGVTFLYNFAT